MSRPAPRKREMYTAGFISVRIDRVYRAREGSLLISYSATRSQSGEWTIAMLNDELVEARAGFKIG